MYPIVKRNKTSEKQKIKTKFNRHLYTGTKVLSASILWGRQGNLHYSISIFFYKEKNIL